MNPSSRLSSLRTVWLLAGAVLIAAHVYAPWKTGIIQGGDAWGYYLYLPAAILYQDLDMPTQTLEARLRYGQRYHADPSNPLGEDLFSPVGEGKYVNRYTVGVSILLLPFFLLAHLLALVIGLPADGYHEIYRYLAHLGAVLYLIPAMLALRQVLRRFLEDQVTAITLVVIVLGTNLFFFLIQQPVMAHALLFSLVSGVLWATVQLYERHSWWLFALLGGLLGLVTLIRPTEILCALIPALYGITSVTSLGERIRWAGKHWKQILLAGLAFGIVMIPQLLYWKHVTGYWVYYSYGEYKLDFLNPHLLDGLFSFSNGWLIYTPLMVLGLAGMLRLGKARKWILPVPGLVVLHVYVIYCWPVWNYINGFGSRPMVEMYPVLAIPMGLCLAWLLQRRWTGWAMAIVLVSGIWLNQLQTWQMNQGILFSEDNHWPYYRAIFGNIQPDILDPVVYDTKAAQPDPEALTNERLIFASGFEDSLSFSPRTADQVFAGEWAVSTEGLEWGPGHAFTAGEAGLTGGEWLEASLMAYRDYAGMDLYRMSFLVISVEGEEPFKLWQGVRIDNKPGNETNSLFGGIGETWGQVRQFVKIPPDIPPGTNIKVYTWHPTPRRLYLDDFEIRVWQNKK